MFTSGTIKLHGRRTEHHCGFNGHHGGSLRAPTEHCGTWVGWILRPRRGLSWLLVQARCGVPFFTAWACWVGCAVRIIWCSVGPCLLETAALHRVSRAAEPDGLFGGHEG